MNKRLVNDETEIKEHYKMYKAGGRWLFASISLITFGSMLMFGTTTSKAATENTEADGSSSTAVTSSAAFNANDSTQVLSTTSNSASTETTDDNNSTTGDAAQSEVSSAAASNSTVASSSASSTYSNATVATSNAASSMLLKTDATVAAAATSSITMSSDTVGYDSSNTGNGGVVNIDYTFTGGADDTFTITLPADSDTYTLGSIPAMTTGKGTMTSVKNADGSTTITYKLSTQGSYTANLTLNQINNEYAHSSAMTDIGTTIKTITSTINGVAQTPVTFTQIIQPSMDPTGTTRLHPDTGVVTDLLPDTDYVYQFSVNEADGVYNDGYTTAKVNSAANYGGTTVTIPTPTGFVLDSDLTNQLNGYTSSSGTTITQPDGAGGDIIISVAASDGEQNWNSTGSYKLAGYYDVTQTDEEQTLTAAGPATVTQVLNAAGDTLTATGSGVWTDSIAATDTAEVGAATVTASGNSSTASTQLLIDGDTTNDPDLLNSFSFTTSTAAPVDDAQITITIPDGLDATGIKVPDGGANTSAYLPGTTSYSYTLTLADGSVETGTVNSGGTITPTDSSAIRQVVLVPNELAPGASSGTGWLSTGKQVFSVYGTVSATYDYGSTIPDGATLVSTISLSSEDANIAEMTNSVTQTVIYPQDAVASVGMYVHQISKTAGYENSGSISLVNTGNAGQTTNSVYEPIYYFVLPSATTVASITNLPDGGVVSYFTADDGREVVEVDYTGSGAYISTQETYLIQINLTNNSDALPGTYATNLYVTSPVTQLKQTTPVTDTSYTNGDANAVSAGSGSWTISSVSTVYDTTLAQGNNDTVPVTDASAERTGDTTLNFYDVLGNTSSATATNVSSVINLPTVGDASGSQYTFELTGPIDLPTSFTTSTGETELTADGTPVTAQVLYSTSLATLNGDAADTSGYVTADQITDWSAVRSILIEYSAIPSNTSTGRISITGTSTDGFEGTTDETGYLETQFSATGYDTVTRTGTDNASLTLKGTIAALSVVLNPGSLTYDGQSKASDATNATVTVTLADGTTQEVSISNAEGKNDFTVANDGINADSYSYILTDSGIANVEKAVGSTIAATDVQGTIDILSLKTSISLNDGGFTYNGDNASSASGLTASVALADGSIKTVALTSADITVTADSSSVGSYKYSLSANGLAAVSAAVGNDYQLNNTTTTGNITITKAAYEFELTGNETESYTGNQQSPDAVNYSVTLPTGEKFVLSDADIELVSGGTDVGSYQVQLTELGKQVLGAIIGTNYDVSFADNATFTIIKAQAAKVSVNDQTIKEGQATPDFNVSYGDGLTSMQLTNSDFEFLGANGQILTEIPTTTGIYTVKLNAAGIAKIEAANPNYEFSEDDFIAGTYTIVSQDMANPGNPGESGDGGLGTSEVTGTDSSDGSVTSTNSNNQVAEVTTVNKTTGSTKRLPQTGESENPEMAELGLGLMSLFAMFGLLNRKKRKQ
ncbi:MBG domain-containing protein [Paucilactobacillus wasatchensis]|uniref:Gram-positive cocci surface proteins LPxTG domain-containing protein n=1 Tax=Paucilactobacillus wasatchensis TaxID=1335616 RepID=A0A0D1A8T0_9LACO|nr:MBG domain-containing protein [Paucilactobacillus wasatchensis]KIS03161.1 hypothetical protein WDC_1237 [Paucilactobacillus wasatchensis]